MRSASVRCCAALNRALAEGSKTAALEARDAMGETLYPTFKQFYELADA